MNTKKIGKFLRQLRLEKGETQESLAERMQKEYLNVAGSGISSIEKGESIPTMDQLVFFSNFYGLSIAEILSGEKISSIDLTEKYIISDRDWVMADRFKNSNENYYDVLISERKKVKDNFRNLLLKFARKGQFSISEKREFDFIVDNFFIELPSTVFDLLNENYKTYKNTDDFYWNTIKSIHYKPEMNMAFNALADINDRDKKNMEALVKTFELNEDWEKDMFLAMIKERPLNYYYSKENYVLKLKYYKEHNQEFDEEQQVIDTIKFVIKNGARLNNLYFSHTSGKPKTKKIIDLLENCYDLAVKDISFCIQDGLSLKHYKMKNNSWNRLFNYHSYGIVQPLRQVGYSNEEIYKICMENEQIPAEVIEKLGEKFSEETANSTELSYKVKMNETFLFSDFENFKAKEQKISKALDDYDKFSKDLNKGETTYNELKLHTYGVGTDDEIREYCDKQNSYIDSYKDFLSHRDEAKTEELLQEIDRLPLSKIFKKYFVFGGKETDE